MNNKTARGARLGKPPIVRIFIAQGIVLVLLAAVLVVIDPIMAYSAFLGGLISIGPNAYFARWAFRYQGAQAASDIARSFYRGEVGKFFLTVILFAGIFAWVKPLMVVALFLTYCAFTVLNWILGLRLVGYKRS